MKKVAVCARTVGISSTFHSKFAVPSPCNSVCRIDDGDGLCEGCFRTLDEIAQWGQLDDTAKRAVWLSIESRQAARRGESS